ncbi:MAG: TetR/AcrR family transcriptional regulator [Hyphomicrobiaceae bacterium]
MFDTTSTQDRIIEATMTLAAEHDWSDVDLAKIANAAETDLGEVRGHFASRTDILKAFSAAVDREVLNRMASRSDDGDVARDRLFDTLMTRFEVMQPWKAALRRLGRDPSLALEMMPVLFNTQRWMLEAAGIPTSGARGNMRTLGTSAIYARVIQTWLNDDDAGMAKTMVALDSRLRRGEKFMERCGDAVDLMCGFTNVIFSRRGRDSRPEAKEPDEPIRAEPA